ncbi:MAG TPA: Ku protein [Actinomycetota bacterium]|nr:Ku protein [Actinomycetota bacterium]
MPRSVWRGTLSFGLVAIPVSLFPATEPKDVRFHLFDREGRRVRYRRVVEGGSSLGEAGPDDADVATAEAGADADADAGERPGSERAEERDGEVEVAYEDLVRGYEVEPEAYVFLEPSEIERARPTPSRAIDLELFVHLDEIDPVYFEKSYQVVPAPGAEKPYALLLRTLAESGRIGIGRFVLRTKPHLVALRPRDDALALETLFFGDEVRAVPASVRDVGRTAVSKRELEVSIQLVEALAAEWDPSMFADEYREGLLRMIAERTPERIEEAPDAGGAESRVGELLEALRRSVDEAKAQGRPKGGRQAG